MTAEQLTALRGIADRDYSRAALQARHSLSLDDLRRWVIVPHGAGDPPRLTAEGQRALAEGERATDRRDRQA